MHRYRFDGTGTNVEDSVGDADGTLVQAVLSGSGTVALSGASTDGYVQLPRGMLSGMIEVTLEVWVTWAGGSSYQRILDFGDATDAGEGRSFVLLSPSCPTALRGSVRGTGVSSISVDAPTALPVGVLSQVVLVLSESTQRLYLYLNGAPVGYTAGIEPLAHINDINNWLGRSQYSIDPRFGGTYHDFRVYREALSEEEISASYAAGPDD